MAGSNTDQGGYYNSKYGTVAIFNGDNYAEFRSTCEAALSTLGALDIVIGTELEPSTGVTARREWLELRTKALIIINSSISTNYIQELLPLIKTRDLSSIWTRLAQYDRGTDETYVRGVRIEFDKLTLGAKESIQAFRARIEALRNKIKGSNQPITDQDVKFKLLNSVPTTPTWQVVVEMCSLNSSSLVDTMNAFQTVESRLNTQNTTASANLASHRGRDNRRGRHRGRHYSKYGRSDRNTDRNSSNSDRKRDNSAGGGSKRDKTGPALCYFCDKPGHIMAECLKFREYKKNKREKGESASVNLARDTEEEYPSVAYLASAALVPSTCIDQALVSQANVEWILDSGATRHFTGVRSDITNLKRWNEPKQVTTASDQVVEAVGYGTVRLGKLELSEVWFVPRFKTIRLISVNQLVKSGYELTFTQRGVTATTFHPVTGQKVEVFKGNDKRGLHYVAGPENTALISTDSEVRNTPVSFREHYPSNSESLAELWHRRLGHTNYTNLAKVRTSATGVEFTDRHVPVGGKPCLGCLAGKMKESYNRSTDTRATTKLFRLHLDLAGPKPVSLGGYKYFLLAVDDATRCTWAVKTKTKETDEIFPKLKELIHLVENLDHHTTKPKVAIIRADNGKGEFGQTFQDYLKQNGVGFEPSPPYKHSLNGVVERAMGTIGNMIRAFLFDADLPPEYWEYALDHAVWMKNRLPTKALPYGDEDSILTPLEKYSGLVPDLSRAKAFGCAAYPINPEDIRRKSDIRTRFGYIFVGLKGSKVYKLLDLKSGHLKASVDAEFDEYRFPRPIQLQGENAGDTHKRQEVTAGPQDLQNGIPSRIEAIPIRPLGVAAEQDRNIRPNLGDSMTSVENDAGGVQSSVTTDILGATGPESSSQALEPGFRDAEAIQVLKPGLRDTEEVLKPGLRDTEVTSVQTKPGSSPSAGTSSGAKRVRKTTTPGRIPDGYTSRYGRKPTRKVFTDAVARVAMEYQPVELACNAISESVNAPAIPLSAVTFGEAMKENPSEWWKSILAELQSIVDQETFSIVSRLPPGRRALSSRWVLTYKWNLQGEVSRRKSRLVIRGFEQQEGSDYFDTFASVVRYSTLRVLLAKAAAEDLEIVQLDVLTAFLNSPLDEEVYMEIPQFYEKICPEIEQRKQDNGGELFVKLNKALYGLKQAPRAWLKEAQDFLTSLGLQASDADPNLFTDRKLFILLYVDDLLIIGDKERVESIKQRILQRWKCRDLGDAQMFIGVQIERDRPKRALRIHQTLYTTKILQRFGMDKANAPKLPFDANTVLKQTTDEDDTLERAEKALYQQIVGCLIYLINCTRVDLCYPLGQLARMMSNPNSIHLEHAKRVLRHLNGNRKRGIGYSDRNGRPHWCYDIYSDSTWGTEPDDRVSFQGWLVLRYGGAVSWSAQRQKSTAQSSMEAELIAANEGAKEAVWMEKLAQDLGERKCFEAIHESNESYGPETRITDRNLSILPPDAWKPTLYCDNNAVLELVKAEKFHGKAKHIEIKYFYIRNDLIRTNRLQVARIDTENQPADLLTKQLPLPAVTRHLETIGMK